MKKSKKSFQKFLWFTIVLCVGLLSVTTFSFAQGGFEDDFSSTTLDPAWIVTDTYPGHGYNSLTGNALRYYVQAWSQPWQDTPTPPNQWGYVYYPSMKLSRSFSGSNWTFETKISYYMPWSNGRDLVMWVCFGSKGNSIWFDRNADQAGYGATADKMLWGSNIDGVTQQGELPISHTYYDTYCFRIVRKDKELTLLWSSDGQNWSGLYNTKMSDSTAQASQYVLISGQSWATPAGSYAAYDYVNVGDEYTVEIVDGSDFSVGKEIESADMNKLASGGREVKAAVADGVTRLLLRLDGSGTAEFSVDDPADGSLCSIDNQQVLNTTVPVQSVPTTQGEKIFAIYKVPENFVSDSHNAYLSEREITIHVKFHPASGGETTAEQRIKLIRPPVVLIHGVWSDLNVWYNSGFVSMLKSSINGIEIITPTYANASHFSNNFPIIHNFLKSEIRRIRNSGIAVSQLDIVTHSMGGVLSRLIYQKNNDFRTDDNFREGYFNKLITIDTPHQGAFLADSIVILRDIYLSPIESLALRFLLNHIGFPIDHGAVDDLTRTNFWLNPLKSVDLPCFTIVGDATSVSGDLANLPGILGYFFNTLKRFGMGTVITLPVHDVIVEGSSQQGGLSLPATDKFLQLHFNFGFPDPYVGAVENIYVKDLVIFLLNSDVGSAYFQRIP